MFHSFIFFFQIKKNHGLWQEMHLLYLQTYNRCVRQLNSHSTHPIVLSLAAHDLQSNFPDNDPYNEYKQILPPPPPSTSEVVINLPVLWWPLHTTAQRSLKQQLQQDSPHFKSFILGRRRLAIDHRYDSNN